MFKIKNLSKTFNAGTSEEHKVFEKFDLEIEEGVCTTILGANGSGKSTLFNLISGSLDIDNGEIILKNKDVSKIPEEKRAMQITKVNQNPSLGVCPSLTIMENMSLAMKKGEKFTFKKLIKKENRQDIIEKLKTLNLGLENKLNTQVKFLSGGQRQSLSLLMATIKRPDLLLLDEHTAALDPNTSNIVMEMTKNLIAKEKITTLMITHNLQNALEYSDRIIMLKQGKVILDVRSSEIDMFELTEFYNKKVA